MNIFKNRDIQVDRFIENLPVKKEHFLNQEVRLRCVRSLAEINRIDIDKSSNFILVN